VRGIGGEQRRTAGGSTSLRDCRVLYLDSASRIEAWNSGTSINGGCRQARTRTQVCLNWSGPFDERQNCLAWSRLLSVQAGLPTATVMAKCLGIRLVNLDSQVMEQSRRLDRAQICCITSEYIVYRRNIGLEPVSQRWRSNEGMIIMSHHLYLHFMEHNFFPHVHATVSMPGISSVRGMRLLI
jgi:hypothetical protein